MTDRNPDAVELVVVEKASNSFEAELIAGILESAGIPAMIDGRFLQDEFAMPQKMLGMKGVKVCVRKEDLEDARQVLADTREAADESGATESNDGGSDDD